MPFGFSHYFEGKIENFFDALAVGGRAQDFASAEDKVHSVDAGIGGDSCVGEVAPGVGQDARAQS